MNKLINPKDLRFLLLMVLCVVNCQNLLLASAEGGVGELITYMELVADKSGYKFSIRLNDDCSLKNIMSDWKGRQRNFSVKDFSVKDSPVKDFGKISQVYLRGVKVVAPTSISGGVQPRVIVVLPFNVQTIYDGSEEWQQSDIIRLIFDDGVLVGWEKAEADPKKHKRWIL